MTTQQRKALIDDIINTLQELEDMRAEELVKQLEGTGTSEGCIRTLVHKELMEDVNGFIASLRGEEAANCNS